MLYLTGVCHSCYYTCCLTVNKASPQCTCAEIAVGIIQRPPRLTPPCQSFDPEEEHSRTNSISTVIHTLNCIQYIDFKYHKQTAPLSESLSALRKVIYHISATQIFGFIPLVNEKKKNICALVPFLWFVINLEDRTFSSITGLVFLMRPDAKWRLL